jgi:hypothetical protein
VGWGRLARRMRFADFLMNLDVLRVVIHKSNHGYHVRVFVGRRLEPVAVVALQACLGSDYRRELNNLERIVVGKKFANILHNDTEREVVFEGDWDAFLRWAGK